MKMVSTLGRVAAPLAFAALLGLAACSSDPTPPDSGNIVENETVDEAPLPLPEPAVPEVVNDVAPANVSVAIPDKIPDEQQMQEDADAAGMTSRLTPRNESASSSEGEVPQ
jgi:hypothetical protein